MIVGHAFVICPIGFAYISINNQSVAAIALNHGILVGPAKTLSLSHCRSLHVCQCKAIMDVSFIFIELILCLFFFVMS